MLGSRDEISSRWFVGAIVGLAVVAAVVAGCSCDRVTWAFVWQDVDCDGEPDESERPLEGVCVWAEVDVERTRELSEYCAGRWAVTDDEGWWGPILGGCSGPIYVFVDTPPGYRPTTQVIAESEAVARFGFAPEGTCPEITMLTPADFAAARLARSRVNTTLIGAVILGVPGLIGLILLGVELRARRRGRV